ncbi:MAG: hypothetical protein AB1489_35415 [Acidobacteriota bacterium]
MSKLQLDPENPRLHLFYLTHELPAQPTQAQIAATLESVSEFQTLIDSIARNNGCFHPPLVTVDYRILEGNRRVAALRKLQAEHPKNGKWRKVTVQQLVKRITGPQEKTARAKYHLEEMLPWDGLSVLTEYVAVAEREGIDALAIMLGRFRRQIEPLLVAGHCLRKFSQTYPQVHKQELLWVLVGLCGIKQIEAKVSFSRTTRCIFSAEENDRPAHQPFPLSKIMQWVAAGRFTKPYQDQQHQYSIRPEQVPTLFRRVRQAGEEIMAYFLEPDGSLAKAIALLEAGQQTRYYQQRRAIALTNKYMELGATIDHITMLVNQQGLAKQSFPYPTDVH